jgi:hypothetical protein
MTWLEIKHHHSNNILVKANAAKQPVAYFEAIVAEQTECVPARLRFMYTSQVDGLMDLSLEEAHTAAVNGGQDPFHCETRGTLQVLTITVDVRPVHSVTVAAVPSNTGTR